MGHLADLLVSGWAIIAFCLGLAAGVAIGLTAARIRSNRRRFVA